MLSDLSHYFLERILTPKIGLLWALLSIGVWLVVDGHSVSALWAPAIAALFVVAFRLMDDLADRANDAQAHPERCLVRSRHVSVFIAMAAFLVAALVLLTSLAFGAVRGLGMVILAIALLVLGRMYGWGAARRALAAKAVLLKYPALILLAAAEPLALSTLGVAAVLFVIPLADDVLA
jgi:hypothetical protein